MTPNPVSPSLLLDHAEAVLNGIHAIPTSHVSRAAAVLARQALEDTIHIMCQDLGTSLPQVSTRMRLIVLDVLHENGAVEAAMAWGGLSNACHHHAYAMNPTVHEIRHLIHLVEQVVHTINKN